MGVNPFLRPAPGQEQSTYQKMYNDWQTQQSEDLARHLALLSEETLAIQVLFDTPWSDRFNVRIWDAFYALEDGRICSAVLIQRQEGVPNQPRYQVQVTPNFDWEANRFYQFGDSDATPRHLALFMQLDRVDPDHRPQWVERKQTQSSTLHVQRAAISDRRYNG